MSKTLSTAEINHLRRLVAWIDCEIGQSPEEMIETAKEIARSVGKVSEEGKQRLQSALEKSANVPKYIRQAIRALRKAVEQTQGEVVDAEMVSKNALPAPMIGVRDWDGIQRERTGIMTMTTSCPNCRIEQGLDRVDSIQHYCDKHSVHFAGQNKQLPITQQAAWERLCNEKRIEWSSTSSIEARALNSLVKKGAAAKVGSIYTLVL